MVKPETFIVKADTKKNAYDYCWYEHCAGYFGQNNTKRKIIKIRKRVKNWKKDS